MTNKHFFLAKVLSAAAEELVFSYHPVASAYLQHYQRAKF